MDKIKIYVEDGKIIVKEPNGTIECDGAEISGPSVVMQDEDKNVWIETESKVLLGKWNFEKCDISNK